MDSLIKSAINKNSSDFILYAKDKMIEKYDGRVSEMKKEISTNIVPVIEADEDVLKRFGITGIKPETYISPGGNIVIGNTDMDTDEIEKIVKAKGIAYTRSGTNINFI